MCNSPDDVSSNTYSDNIVQVDCLITVYLDFDATSQDIHYGLVLELFREVTKFLPIILFHFLAECILLFFDLPRIVINLAKGPHVVQSRITIYPSRILATCMPTKKELATETCTLHWSHFIVLHRGGWDQSISSLRLSVKGGSSSLEVGVRSGVSRSLITKP